MTMNIGLGLKHFPCEGSTFVPHRIRTLSCDAHGIRRHLAGDLLRYSQENQQ
jgi:hypothetical protein